MPGVHGEVSCLQLELPRRKLRRFLALFVAIVLAVSTAARLLWIAAPGLPGTRFFGHVLYVDQEQSLPTLLSVLLLAVCACALGAVALVTGKQRRREYRHWLALSLLFCALASDEYLALHERLIDPLRERLGAGGLLYFTWVVPGLAFVVIVAVLFARFVLSLPPRVRRELVLAGACYVGGVLGMEMLGGLYAEGHSISDLAFLPFPTIEEGLEMAGAALLLDTTVEYLRVHLGVDAVELVLEPNTV